MDSKFDNVIEDHATLNMKIDDLANKTEERFDLVDFKIPKLIMECIGSRKVKNKPYSHTVAQRVDLKPEDLLFFILPFLAALQLCVRKSSGFHYFDLSVY